MRRYASSAMASRDSSRSPYLILGVFTWTSSDEPIIPISPTLQQVLLEPYARRHSKQWVFGNQKGQPDGHSLEKPEKIWSARPPRPQPCMRYDTASGRISNGGGSLADIADLLGDEDLATTRIDAKVQQEHLWTVVAKLTGLVAAQNLGCVVIHTRHTRRAECDDSQKFLEAVDLGRRATGTSLRHTMA
jgi:hypothetical protein